LPTEGHSKPASIPEDSRLRKAIEAAVAQLEPIPPQQGTGVISGALTDQLNGAPLVGFIVEVRGHSQTNDDLGWIYRPDTSLRPNDTTDVVTPALRAIEAARAQAARNYHTYSGADGRYEITNLPVNTYSIEARGPDYELRLDSDTSTSWASRCKPGDTMNFHGFRFFELKIDVLMPDGSRPAPLELKHGRCKAGLESAPLQQMIEACSFESFRNWKAPGDAIFVSEGTHLIRVETRPDHGSVTAEVYVVRAGPGGTTSVTIQLMPVGGIEVAIKDNAEDFRYHAMEVLCVPATGTNIADRPEVFRESYSLRSNKRCFNVERHYLTGAWLPILFRDLDPGEYDLAMFLSYDTVLAWQRVTVKSAPVRVQLTIPHVPRSDYTLVWVKDPHGKLIDHSVTVAAAHVVGREYTAPRGISHQLKNGAHAVMHFKGEHADQPSTDSFFVLRAISQTYGYKEVRYRPTDAAEITIQYEIPARLEVFVEGLAEIDPKPTIILFERKERGIAYPWNEIRTKPDPTGRIGRFYQDPLQPGPMTLSLGLEMHGRRQLELSRSTISLVSGLNSLTFRLPALFPLTVTCPADAVDGSVWLAFPETQVLPDGREIINWNKFAEARAGTDGQAHFPFLPTGTFRLYCTHPRTRFKQSQDVTVIGPTVVAAELE